MCIRDSYIGTVDRKFVEAIVPRTRPLLVGVHELWTEPGVRPKAVIREHRRADRDLLEPPVAELARERLNLGDLLGHLGVPLLLLCLFRRFVGLHLSLIHISEPT